MIIESIRNAQRLRKSRRILRQMDRLYRRKKNTLDPSSQALIEAELKQLQGAILNRDGKSAAQHADQMHEIAERHLSKSLWERGRDFILAIVFALAIAIVVRQMWFELYTIPTGSMRPTLKEGDFLSVSKTSYGLNVPLTTSHFHFNPSLVQRGDIIVFTGEGMDIPDSDTVYFYLFPGKKQFVKRLIAKPGDMLYFYGGQIFGIDAEGRDLKELRDPSWFVSNEHIPFIRFDGRIEAEDRKRGLFSPVTFYQMNEPVARMSALSLSGPVSGSMIASEGRKALSDYSELWGFGNYAMARLLTIEQVGSMHPAELRDLPKSPLYLELTHHPSIKKGRVIRDEMHRLRPDFGFSVSLIPLEDEHINRIASHMTTCRFVVEEGAAYRYGYNGKDKALSRYFPRLANVPDGTYEIQDGKAYQILWGNVTQELPKNHPLYGNDAERIQLLYNLGIEFLTYYSPYKENRAFPSRYAYFRNDELYLLGAPIFKKTDPALTQYIEREEAKQTRSPDYIPFVDTPPPLSEEGAIDPEFLRTFGLLIPPGTYLALGDNHAMSGDSRQFGFVPQNNLKGTARFLFWPPGSRWGFLPEPPQPFATFPHLFVWGAALSIGYATWIYYRRRYRQPLKFD